MGGNISHHFEGLGYLGNNYLLSSQFSSVLFNSSLCSPPKLSLSLTDGVHLAGASRTITESDIPTERERVYIHHRIFR